MRRVRLGLLIGASMILLAVADILILIVPLRRIVSHLGHPLGPVEIAPLATADQGRRANLIRRAIAAAADRVPFRSDCYPQALAAAMLCRLFDVPIAVHFGARMETPVAGKEMTAGAMAGHLWVVSGMVSICGGQAAPSRFRSVACFMRPLPAAHLR